MSKKKSLGSSPIGFHSDNSTFGFIPDLGVSQARDNQLSQDGGSPAVQQMGDRHNGSLESERKEKKIVSYNLEVDLISKVKTIADKRDLYYSSLVSLALKKWLMDNT